MFFSFLYIQILDELSSDFNSTSPRCFRGFPRCSCFVNVKFPITCKAKHTYTLCPRPIVFQLYVERMPSPWCSPFSHDSNLLCESMLSPWCSPFSYDSKSVVWKCVVSPWCSPFSYDSQSSVWRYAVSPWCSSFSYHSQSIVWKCVVSLV